jgi:hypothetical protein
MYRNFWHRSVIEFVSLILVLGFARNASAAQRRRRYVLFTISQQQFYSSGSLCRRDADLPAVFPNINNFGVRNLGFV